jgi:rRNA maturation RNase YbeY
MIYFHYSKGIIYRVKNSKKVKTWLLHAIKNEKKNCGILHFYFVSENELYAINAEFLKHHSHTDIITFDYSEKNKIVGEIFICPLRVKENAALYKTSFKEEMLRVMIHGILHLCGYKDKKKKEKEIMRIREFHYIKIYLNKFEV